MRGVNRTLVARVACAVLCAAVSLLWWNARRAPRLGPDFRVQGTYQCGMSPVGPSTASWSVRSDGHAEVTRDAGWTYGAEGRRLRYDSGSRAYELTPYEVSRLRATLDASGVFGDWTAEEEYSDGSVWAFTLSSGARSVSRKITGVHAFDEADHFLTALIRQAHVELLIDGGQVPTKWELSICLRPDAALRRLREVFGDHPPGWK